MLTDICDILSNDTYYIVVQVFGIMFLWPIFIVWLDEKNRSKI